MTTDSTKPTFSVKSFEQFQHYKDRNPPWIKLYNSVLDDYDIGRLQDASKAHLFAIWLLASRYDNIIPYDAEWVSRRINATSTVDLDALAEAGFIVVDQGCSNMLADCKQSACLEGEGEGEGDTPVGGFSPEKELFDYGKSLLGKKSGGVITKLKNARGINGAMEILHQAAGKSDPAEWVGAVLANKREQVMYCGRIPMYGPDGELSAEFLREVEREVNV